jgi:hypothetical protein
LGNQNKVVKFKRRRSINIGVIVFLILFLYIAINVYLYFTKDQLSIYEVHEGTTAIDNHIKALILREEKVVNSNKAGYVSYFQKEGARVAKNASVISINESAQVFNASKEDTSITLSDKNNAEIKHDIRNFINNFSNDNYEAVYDFQENAQSTVLDILNTTMIGQGDAAAGSYEMVPSQESGIVTYYIDNFETVTPDTVTDDMYQTENYKKTSLRTSEMIAENSPVYKIITSDVWKLVLSLSKDQYDLLAEKETVSFTVLEDDTLMTAGLELSKRGSSYYAILKLDKNLSNYLEERYIDVELNFDSVDGLKIPLTSIVEKEAYKVPVSYFTMGAESKDRGLIKETYSENGDVSYNFIPTEIYYEDTDYAYIDADMFPTDTWIHSSTDTNRCQLKDIAKLTGVYNVNQGYAVFKYIEILSQNEEYCIIKADTRYGLSAYDHIALNGKLAVEQEIIY